MITKDDGSLIMIMREPLVRTVSVVEAPVTPP